MVALTAGEDPTHFGLTVTPDLCVGDREHRFLFGGAGLAAAAVAMERVTERPLNYASAQFLSFARPGERLALTVQILAEGRQTSQAIVTGAVGGRLVFSVAGALGARSAEEARQFATPPVVPAPRDCPLVRHWRGDDGIHASLDIRVVKGRYGADQGGAPAPDGRMILWVRPREGCAIDLAFLAIVADLVPGGIGNALGQRAGGNSLDNVLRVGALPDTAWVLVDVRIVVINAGVAIGTVTLSSEEGVVMAHGSQSIIVRAPAQ